MQRLIDDTMFTIDANKFVLHFIAMTSLRVGYTACVQVGTEEGFINIFLVILI
jgi:hypothetical protein